MKMCYFSNSVRGVAALCLIMAGRFASPGQSTVTFNSNPWWTGTDYHEQGMGFHVILPGTWPSHDDMGIAPNGVNGTSSLDGTPYMSFHQQLNPSDYVSFTLLNGSAFGDGMD